MKIEQDQAHISSGVRWGLTLGSPITPHHPESGLGELEAAPCPSARPRPAPPAKTVTRPRPGHADLAGAMKYGHHDIRNVLERSSARETTARVAVAGVAKRLLGEFGITILSHVTEIGGVAHRPARNVVGRGPRARGGIRGPLRRSRGRARDDRGHRPGEGGRGHAGRGVRGRRARAARSAWAPTCSGTGSSTACSPGPSAPSTRSRARRSGIGFEAARRPGSQVHDEILFDTGRRASTARSNSAGGLEGGVTNGQPVVVRAAMKPISTLRKPLRSVDVDDEGGGGGGRGAQRRLRGARGRRRRRGHDGASCWPTRSSRSSAATASTRSAATTRATSDYLEGW